jgi:hypothetical protein
MTNCKDSDFAMFNGQVDQWSYDSYANDLYFCIDLKKNTLPINLIDN